MIEFLARASGRDMTAKKPHQIVDDKIESWGMTSVSLVLVAIASEAEFEALILMDSLHKMGTFLR